MRAIILAAGRGSRLGYDGPKCLAKVGNRTLLEHQVETLALLGVEEIAVVAGYQAPRVAGHLGRGIQVITNTRYAVSNSLYSLWLARHLLSDRFVVMNCDVLFHPQVLHDLLTSRHENALLVAYREAGVALGDEEMKVKVRCGQVADISKEMDPSEADGENVGVAMFGSDGTRLLVEVLDSIVARGGSREWVPRAFQHFARLRPLHVVSTRGYPWTEIDFPDDLERARSEVLPAIEAIPFTSWPISVETRHSVRVMEAGGSAGAGGGSPRAAAVPASRQARAVADGRA